MLYLIESMVVKTSESILKIGYSSKPWEESRKKSYDSMNPGHKLLGTREGDEILEDLLHILFKDSLCFGKEWFKYKKEIIDVFNYSDEELYDYLYDNKDKILDDSYFEYFFYHEKSISGTYTNNIPSKTKKNILDRLFSKRKSNFKTDRFSASYLHCIYEKYYYKIQDIDRVLENDAFPDKKHSDKGLKLYCEYYELVEKFYKELYHGPYYKVPDINYYDWYFITFDLQQIKDMNYDILKVKELFDSYCEILGLGEIWNIKLKGGDLKERYTKALFQLKEGGNMTKTSDPVSIFDEKNKYSETFVLKNDI